MAVIPASVLALGYAKTLGSVEGQAFCTMVEGNDYLTTFRPPTM